MRTMKLTLLAAALFAAQQSTAAVPVDTEAFRAAITPQGVRAHQYELQSIADTNGGTRAASTPGHEASLEYIKLLVESAGYVVTVQPFEFPYFQEQSPAQLEQLEPAPTVYPYAEASRVISHTHTPPPGGIRAAPGGG